MSKFSKSLKINYLFMIVLLTIVILFNFPLIVNATGGGLRKYSIKTCPNGITYGLHSDGKGGTHWHKAKTNGRNYYADGKAIASDPCPKSNKMKGNANNNTTSNYPSTKSKKEEKVKNNDTSLKSVTIDGKEIIIGDSMSYKTYEKNIIIDIKANSDKAKVSFNPIELKVGDNIINVKVIAENGEIKQYELKIIRMQKLRTVTIKKFILGSGEVRFENNKSTIKKLVNETKLDYSYELSNPKDSLDVYHNDKKVKKLENVKDNDIIKLIVSDEYGNENLYEITIVDASVFYSYMIYGISFVIVTLLFIAPIVLIIYFVLRSKKKNEKLSLNKFRK